MDRYRIVPQMLEYDQIGLHWLPYFMFFQRPEYKSKVVNTDKFGFRFSGSTELISPASWVSDRECSLIVGSSTAFGVGATRDNNTIASFLNKHTGESYLSVSGRAFNSKQELILFIAHISVFKNIKRIVLVSGANNLYTSVFSDIQPDPMFYSQIYGRAMDDGSMSKNRKLLRFFGRTIGLNDVDWPNVRLSELLDKFRVTLLGNDKTDESNQKAVDVNNAATRTCGDLFVWRSLAEAMKFDLIYCLQPVPGWCEKQLCNEERMLFDTLDTDVDDILSQLSLESTGEAYGKAISSFCKKNGIRYKDLNSEFRDKHEWLFVDRVHLTDLGYELVAKAILDVA